MSTPTGNCSERNGKRKKPFQTKQYKGKGSKAEMAQKINEKYGHLKGGVWEPEEEERLLQMLQGGQTEQGALAAAFNRTVRVVRRKLKRIAVEAAEDGAGLEQAAALTGLLEE